MHVPDLMDGEKSAMVSLRDLVQKRCRGASRYGTTTPHSLCRAGKPCIGPSTQVLPSFGDDQTREIPSVEVGRVSSLILCPHERSDGTVQSQIERSLKGDARTLELLAYSVSCRER